MRYSKKNLSFVICHLSFQKGITLLLVVVILSVLLSISLGIFNLVFGQIKISGEIADSFVAFYNADRAIEKFLYIDRVGGGLGDGYTEDTTADANANWCYKIIINKTEALCGIGNTACIKSIGQYRCGTNPSRAVKRGFQVVY